MENFDIAKYLKEHQLGSYGILNHYVDLKPINELGVEQDYMYDPYADEYNHNAIPGTNSVYNAASKKADELEKQAKQAEKMGDPNARQLRLAAAEAREEAFKYAQMFRETVSENDQMDTFSDDEDFYSGTYDGDSRAGGLVNQLDLKKIAEAVVSIIEDLEADGYHPEEIQEFLIDKVREVCRPYMK